MRCAAATARDPRDAECTEDSTMARRHHHVHAIVHAREKNGARQRRSSKTAHEKVREPRLTLPPACCFAFSRWLFLLLPFHPSAAAAIICAVPLPARCYSACLIEQ